MFQFKKLYILTFLFLLFISKAFTQDPSENYKLVKVVLDKVTLKQIASLGLEADHGIIAPGKFWMNFLNENEWQLLTNNGIDFTFPASTELDLLTPRNIVCEQEDNSPDPQHFRLGVMGGFYSPDEMNAILDSMHLLFPNLISTRNDISTFKTYEGRPIQYLRMSNNPTVDQDKPKVLFTALHHAREPMGLTQLIYFMWDMLENYDTNPEIKQLIDNTEIYFVPCINPDGYNYNFTNKPNGGGMWRKNRTLNPGGSIGVDLNRNYGLTWGHDDIGSSPMETSDTYRGASAFSEPETQAIAHLIDQYPFSLALNYHTFGNYLIHPWSHIDEPCPDDMTFKNIGRTYGQENKFAIGTASETVGYKTNGGSDDWIYGHDVAHKVFSMTPELGLQSDGFWPDKSRIRSLAKNTLKGNKLWAMMAHRYFEVNMLDPLLLINNTENNLEILINKIGIEEGPVNVKYRILSSNATLANSSYTYDLLANEQALDEVKISPEPGVKANDLINLEITKEMGLISETDTLTFVVVESTISDLNECDDFSSVTSSGGSWGLDSEVFYSAPTSFSDSPGADYADNLHSSIVFNDLYSIPLEGTSVLSCWIKWDIEANYDYGQIYAVTDEGEVPLCGKYTKPGNSFQVEGQPLYDGISVHWVKEEFILDDFKGQVIQIGCRMVSDEGEVREGIFIDDLELTIYSKVLSSDISEDDHILNIYPNPVSDVLTIETKNIPGAGVISILNVLGAGMISKQVSSLDKNNLDVSALQPGIYFLEISKSNGQKVIKRWIKS